jgi:hypothetical protein
MFVCVPKGSVEEERIKRSNFQLDTRFENTEMFSTCHDSSFHFTPQTIKNRSQAQHSTISYLWQKREIRKSDCNVVQNSSFSNSAQWETRFENSRKEKSCNFETELTCNFLPQVRISLSDAQHFQLLPHFPHACTSIRRWTSCYVD